MTAKNLAVIVIVAVVFGVIGWGINEGLRLLFGFNYPVFGSVISAFLGSFVSIKAFLPEKPAT